MTRSGAAVEHALIGEIWSVTDPMIRRDLTDTGISELVRHVVAEERYVYPAMRKHLPGDERCLPRPRSLQDRVRALFSTNRCGRMHESAAIRESAPQRDG
jgi:hypothetical protein